jgi:Lactonase, 7-bladed beta-propeller
VAKDPITLTVSPDGSSVYALTYGVQYGSSGVTSNGKINAFHRDPGTENLTLVQTTPLDTSSNFGGAVGIDPVVSPDGHFIYVTSPSASGGIYVLNRDITTGTVAVQERDGNLNAGNALAISPDGNDVYETGAPSQSSSASSAISVLSRNMSTGHLTPVSEIQNGADGVSGLGDMWGVAVSPDGRCLYATSRADNSLGYFTRNQSSGALTFGGAVSEGSGGVTGLANARQVTVSPDGNNLYVASPNDNGVAVFSRHSTTCAPTFLELAQDLFTLGQPSVDPTQGTATLPVSVDTGGALDVSVSPVTAGGSRARPAAADPQVIQVSQAGVVKVPVTLDPQQAEELDALHALRVKATLTFTASGGTATTKATVIQLVKVSGSVSTLRMSPSRFSLSGRKVRGRCVAPTRRNNAREHCRRPLRFRVSYALNVPDSVTFTIKVQVSGRRVGRLCAKPTSKNRRHRKCMRLVALRGQIGETGNAGADQFTWGGVIGGHRLGPGRYTLIATPLGGTAKQLSFKLRP